MYKPPPSQKCLFYFPFIITVESLSVTIENDTCVEFDTVLLFSLPNIHVFSPQWKSGRLTNVCVTSQTHTYSYEKNPFAWYKCEIGLTSWVSELLSEWRLSLGELHPDAGVLLLLEEESAWRKEDTYINSWYVTARTNVFVHKEVCQNRMWWYEMCFSESINKEQWKIKPLDQECVN